MNTIQIEAEVGKDHRLVDAFPPEVPVGRVKLLIEPLAEPNGSSKQPLTREEACRRWKAAGKKLVEPSIPEGMVRSTEEEHLRLARLFGQGPSSDHLIDEDRGPHE